LHQTIKSVDQIVDHYGFHYKIAICIHSPFKNCIFNLWLKLPYNNNYVKSNSLSFFEFLIITYFFPVETGNSFIPRRRHTVCAMPRSAKTASFPKKFCTLCSWPIFYPYCWELALGMGLNYNIIIFVVSLNL